ncbi:Phasin domain-containing protein [Candidatus Magnetomoraceae bacterium gMMP-15]
METGKIANQMVSFQKNLFENTFKAMTMVQDQTEKMMTDFITQFPWINDDGKKSLSDSIDYYKKAREDFKSAVNDGFKKMEELFSGSMMQNFYDKTGGK